VKDTARLVALFQKAGLTSARLRTVKQEGGAHSEVCWAQRFPEAVQFLFPAAK